MFCDKQASCVYSATDDTLSTRCQSPGAKMIDKH